MKKEKKKKSHLIESHNSVDAILNFLRIRGSAVSTILLMFTNRCQNLKKKPS